VYVVSLQFQNGARSVPRFVIKDETANFWLTGLQQDKSCLGMLEFFPDYFSVCPGLFREYKVEFTPPRKI